MNRATIRRMNESECSETNMERNDGNDGVIKRLVCYVLTMELMFVILFCFVLFLDKALCNSNS